MTTIYDVRVLHHRALDDCSGLVAAAADTDLRAPTPCDGWDLAALLRHMVGQNHGFATAVAEGDAPLTAYDGPEVTPMTLMPAWYESTARVRESFSSPAQDGVHLAELGVTVPVEFAVRMHLLDAVVHAWDIARSMGGDHRPDSDLVDPVLADARAIAARPGGAPGFFAAPVQVSGPPESPADPWFEALRLLGRRP